MGGGALNAAVAPRRTLVALVLAALLLVALTVSACLTSGAGHSSAAGHSFGTGPAPQATAAGHQSTPDQDTQHQSAPDPSTANQSEKLAHQCPDQGPPVPACHNQADLQLTTHAAGPRPDADLRWDHPRYAAERAGLPGSPFADPAPDLIALSISRT